MATKKAESTAKQEYLSLLETCTSKRMLDYYKKTYQEVIKLESGYFYAVEKQGIQKSFCFGHGQNGVSTEDEQAAAFAMEKIATTNFDYFINENLQNINRQIEDIKNPQNVIGLNETEKYNSVWICCIKSYELPYFEKSKDTGVFRNPQNPWETYTRIATEQERANIIEAMENVKHDLEKRLNVYLKKYGLSKIHTWTYLVD